MKKVWIILGIIIPIIIALVAATNARTVEPADFVEEPMTESMVEPAMAVEGIQIIRGKLIGSIEVSGVVEGTREVYVVSEFGGTIADLNVELGDYVLTGDALAVLSDKGQGYSLEQVTAQLENAQREFKASETLFEKGAASAADLTRATSALKGIEAAYKRALDSKDSLVMTAPISGYIADLDPGATVGNLVNPGTRVARIVDLSSLKMRASLGERQIALIDRGAATSIRFSEVTEMSAADAEITAIAAGADPSTGAYRVIVEWPNQYEIARSGMTATAVISTNEKTELLAPASALVTRNGITGGFIYRDGTASFTPIETGKRFGDNVTIKAGVEDGDILLVSGTTTLIDGDRVKVQVIGSGKTEK